MNSKILPKVVIFLLMSIYLKESLAQGRKLRWYIDFDSKFQVCEDEKRSHRFCSSWKDCGLCEDEYDSFVMRRYCAFTCGFCKPPSPPKCFDSEFGCCWDWKTKALSADGKGCPRCHDKFRRLCSRFVKQCDKPGKNGQYIRLKCGKTCQFCRRDELVITKDAFIRHTNRFALTKQK